MIWMKVISKTVGPLWLGSSKDESLVTDKVGKSGGLVEKTKQPKVLQLFQQVSERLWLTACLLSLMSLKKRGNTPASSGFESK